MYPLEVIICSGLLYGLYRLLLEGRVAHRFARAYLVLSALFAIVVPLLELPILPAEPESNINIALTNNEVVTETVESVVVATPENGIDWSVVVLALYASISVIMVIRMVAGVVNILLLRRRCTIEHYREYNLAVNSSITKPFSFWRTIFVSTAHRDIEHILLHEQSHITHRHTIEKLLIELVRSIMWFNPFIHLAARALSQVQEWEADSDVLNQGVDIDLYRKTIFHQLFGYTPDITCGLNNNLTKKRFIMMTTFKRGKSSLLRILAVIPIVVATILIFGSVHAKPKQEVTEPVIIDSFDIKSTIQIRDGGKEIILNEEPVTLKQLGEAAKQTIDNVVTIFAENDVPMGTVADIKETLRESGVTKVNYSRADGEIEQGNIYATINSNSNEQSEEVAEAKETLRESGVTKVNNSKPETTTKTIKARNILIVDVKADGSVFVRGEQFTNENKLKREVKRFIHNFRLVTINTRVLRIVKISGGRQYEKNSEFTTTAVKMGEGVRMACPVSKGIVSINSELPMGSPALESVSSTIYEVFMELREKMAHRIYGKSYDKIDEAQKAEIDKVVPINISLAVKK